MIQAVVFDVGGTLIWGNGNHYERANAWRTALVLHGLGLVEDAASFAHELEALRRISRKEGPEYSQTGTTRDHLTEMCRRHGIAVTDEFLHMLEEEFVMPEATGSVAIPGMPDLAREIAREVPVAIASNVRSHRLTLATLHSIGLAGLPDVIVTSVSARYRKPAPQLFADVLDGLGTDPAATVMVGDSRRKDVQGAQQAGMQGIWFTADRSPQSASLRQEKLWPDFRPEAAASSADGLAGILRGLGLKLPGYNPGKDKGHSGRQA